MSAQIVNLVPMVHVVDVLRSVRFYEQLGLVVGGTLKKDSGGLQWAYLRSNRAEIMFVQADAPVSRTEQGVLFYLYADDLRKLREDLLARGVAASEITYPFYMQKGEMRVEDPDGYSLLIGQTD